MMKKTGSFLFYLVGIVVTTVTLIQAVLFVIRPSKSKTHQKLFHGIDYYRGTHQFSKTFVWHVLEIDLQTKGIQPFIAPAKNKGKLPFSAITTSDFLSQNHLQVAINGSFFSPFHSISPWNYYPKSGDPVKVNGRLISEGKSFSAAGNQYVLCFAPHKQASITFRDCPKPNATFALAGYPLLLKEGKIPSLKRIRKASSHAPRTAVGLNSQGTKLWLFVIDGRQAFYSAGVTFSELIRWIQIQFPQATWVLNLDGGGSSSMVYEKKKKATLLNSPIHTKIPMRERPVGSHLGFFALERGK